MIPLLTFDMLDSDWTTKYVFNFDFEWHEEHILKNNQQQLELLGYETYNSVLVLGSLWVYACFYFSMLILFYVLKCITDNKKRRRKLKKKKWKCLELKRWLNRVLFFRSFITLFVEGYFEFLIAIIMNLKNPYPDYEFGGEVIGWFSALLFIVVIFVLLPILTLYVTCSGKKKHMHPHFYMRFDLLIEDVRPKGFLSKMYFLLFQLRRVVFVMTVFFGDVPSYA